MPLRVRSIRILLAAIFFLSCGWALGPIGSASAQQDEARWTPRAEPPWRLDVVDVTKRTKDSKRVVKSVRDGLEKRDDVELASGAFTEAESAPKVSKLRTSKGRAKQAEALASAIEEAGLDGIVLVDAYSRGKKLQLLLIGPDGQPAREIKERLAKRRRLTKKQRGEFLGELLDESGEAMATAAAAIIAQREPAEVAPIEEVAETAEAGDGLDETTELAVSETVDVEAQGRASEFVLGVGGLIGQRSFELPIEGAEPISQDTQLGGASADLRLTVPLGAALNLGIEGDFAWAPLALDYVGVEGTEELGGAYVRGRGGVRLGYDFAGSFGIGILGGADVTSVTIDANPSYTGHRYIAARAGLDLVLRPSDAVRVSVHGLALPILSASTSGGAYGERDGGLGYEAGGDLAYFFTESIGLGARYSFTRFDLDYAPVGQADALSSSDGIHQGSIALRVRL